MIDEVITESMMRKAVSQMSEDLAHARAENAVLAVSLAAARKSKDQAKADLFQLEAKLEKAHQKIDALQKRLIAESAECCRQAEKADSAASDKGTIRRLVNAIRDHCEEVSTEGSSSADRDLWGVMEAVARDENIRS